jgi:hypothetical protein
VSKQGQIPPTTARGSPSPAVPRTIAFVRRLFVLSGVLSTAYVSLALMELDRLAALAHVRELTVYTIGLALVTMATMLPFALLVRRARPWARSGMIITCVILITLAVILIAADAAVMPPGNPQLAAGWLPVLHYATSGVVLAAAIGGVVGLIRADAGEYFRRHQQVAGGDPRLWTIARLRNLQTARVAGARLGVVRSLQSASPIDVVPAPPAHGGRPEYEAFARAA